MSKISFPFAGSSAAFAFARSGIGFPRVNFAPEGDPTPDPTPDPKPIPAPTRPNGFSSEYVHDLREENKSWRQKLADEKAARKADTDAKSAAETAAEKARTDSAAAIEAAKSDATKAADARVIRAELRAVAAKAGMVDLDGLKLADLSTVKLNEAGEVEGADALMEALKTSKPYLFGNGKSGTSTTDPVPSKDGNPVKKISEMTLAEYAIARKNAANGKLT